MSNQNSWLSWLVFIAGLWLIISPFILGYSGSGTAASNDIIVGIVVAVLGFINAVWGRTTASWLPWITAIVGLYLIAAPFFLNYRSLTSAFTNDIILGIIIVVLGGSRALTASGTMMRTGTSYYSEERPRRRDRSDNDNDRTD